MPTFLTTHRRLILSVSFVLTLVGLAWIIWPFWQLSAQFDEVRSSQPSRLYGRPYPIAVGQAESEARLVEELTILGYREVEEDPSSGQYRRTGRRLQVGLRARPTASGWQPPGQLDVRFSGGRVLGIRWQGLEVPSAALEPPVLASFLGTERREKRPMRFDQLPAHLVQAVLAAEDASFYSHQGLSLRGIARAALADLRELEFQQGGSTVTQQLVKNIFLSHERTIARKLREAVLAILVDLRYEKDEILNAYLNEIYWGASDGVNLIGVGAASWAYFGKQPPELDLCESALLAALIRSPGNYSPRNFPEKALGRRNWIFGRMVKAGALSQTEAEAASDEPLCYQRHRVPVRQAPYFLDFAAGEAERRFGVSRLEDAGYVLLSTLDHWSQQAAEEAVSWGLEALEAGWEKSRGRQGELQSALLSIEPESGAILAYVGGRNYRFSQFDRASNARRQAGSAFKPIVYAAALERQVVSPATFLEDAPITVAQAGRRWSPQNSDGDFRGWVTARTALERSLNIPTVRVALDVGLANVIGMAQGLGLGGSLERVPSLALGAFEVTPLELATVYSSLAAGGQRPPVHALRAVLDPAGEQIAGAPLPEPERVLSPEAAYVLTTLLQGVLDRGTAAAVRTQGLHDTLAGKTGTTNDRRDSWFAGYSPQRASLVWVGYDDNAATRLSGARAALPIWTKFTYKVRPRGGYGLPRQPAGVVTAVIDSETGELATGACPEVITEYFLDGGLPERVCALHGEWQDWLAGGETTVRSRRAGRRPWRWLSRVFGRKKDRPKPPP